MTYFVEELKGIVMDIGSHTCKVGYAGEHCPKYVYSSAVGHSQFSTHATTRTLDQHRKKFKNYQVVETMISCPVAGMEIVSLFKENGAIENWDAFEAVYEHAFSERLRIDPREHPMMLSKSPILSKHQVEQIVEIMMENFELPAMFLANSHALSSFSLAKQTSVVVDAGHQATTLAAVFNGCVIQSSLLRSPLGGHLLTQLLRSVLEENARNSLLPRYEFQRKHVNDSCRAVSKMFPQVAESYRTFEIEQIAQDIKESLCKVAAKPIKSSKNLNIPPTIYELPDGTNIKVGDDTEKIPELIFQPAFTPHYRKYLQNKKLQGLTTLLSNCVNACEPNVRKGLYAGIIMTGGCSLFTGIVGRLERDLTICVPSTNDVKVKAISPLHSLERKFSSWIGGSILASLGSFQQMWMSKHEYEENGATRIHRKML